MQIIQPRLGVVIVAPVAERIERSNVVCRCISYSKQLAPRIIGICYHLIAARVKYTYNIILPVTYVVVVCAVVIEAEEAAVLVIEEVEPCAVGELGHYLIAVEVIVSCNIVYDLLCTDTTVVVGVAHACSRFVCSGKLAAVLPCEGIAAAVIISQGIYDLSSSTEKELS